MHSYLKTFSFLAFLVIGAGSQAHAEDTTPPYRDILHTLDYLAVDYPGCVVDGKVVNAAEYSEQQEMAERLQELFQRMPEGEQRDALSKELASLAQAINERRAGAEVQGAARSLAASILASYPVDATPRSAPLLARAPLLFQEHCSGCHGETGLGDGAMAEGLDPAPANFHDAERQRQLNVFGLFNTITLGVEGTGMRAFSELSDEERWILAFYVSGFLTDAATRAQGEQVWQNGAVDPETVDLKKVTLLAPEQATAAWGEQGEALLAWLRANPSILTVSDEAPLATTRRLLDQSLASYAEGKKKLAQDQAVAAYLEGFELIERRLDTQAPELRLKIEAAMQAWRADIRQGVTRDQLQQRYGELTELLTEAETNLVADASPWLNFMTAFVILLREGVEAILVLAAVFALLIQAGQREAVRYVHAGWIGALALGVLTWFVAERVFQIGGAGREVTEGVIALITAAMLIYVGFWLHSHANSQKWQEYIRKHIGKAVGTGALWGLSIMAFLAVYREVFESILFYQSLWMQSAGTGIGSILGGAGSAAVLLVLVAWAVFRLSVRLPLKLFFRVNAAILFALALIFTGKGVAALQEAGHIPVNPISFPRIDLLGIYPNIESLGMQLVVILMIGGWFAYNKYRTEGDQVTAP